MLYDVGISGTRSLRPELFGLSDSCGAHSSYTVLDDQSPINPKNLKNKNTFKMAATLLAQPATYFIKTWVDTCEVKTFSIWRMLQLPNHERDEVYASELGALVRNITLCDSKHSYGIYTS